MKKTDELLFTAKRLKDDGMSYERIGHKLGVSPTTVRRWLVPSVKDYHIAYRNDPINKKRIKEYYSRPDRRAQSSLHASKTAAKKYGHVECLASVEELVDSMTGECYICGRPEPNVGKKHQMDHCHTTGRFRGWLCQNCNLGLGHFQHSQSLLKKANDYLDNR